MEVYAFWALSDRLHRDVALCDSSREVTVEEALGMFCYTIGHGAVQQNGANLFQHSVETVNQHVYNVMRALCGLSRHVIKPSQTTGVMPYIEGNLRHYPWFKICHGAMEGIMIDRAVPASVANAYINRYHRVAQNVLCVCDFDMKVTFVYASNPNDYLDMNADENTSEEPHVPDMSTASAHAMAITRNVIALPLWMHTTRQQGN
ncbi:uncharacterized protein LOC121242291 [Juglans microcarpa x Juglans regia]|uniref:uncharacterized protein LOC121242291 n=1 Tax=Juglans microcarpa x Juglans regia TaxID=2249226 RepID=UPI001B7F77CC|nr:uncharacterized protein LOC121242291 [Juglans microcarpa x Juglans regia]